MFNTQPNFPLCWPSETSVIAINLIFRIVLLSSVALFIPCIVKVSQWTRPRTSTKHAIVFSRKQFCSTALLRCTKYTYNHLQEQPLCSQWSAFGHCLSSSAQSGLGLTSDCSPTAPHKAECSHCWAEYTCTQERFLNLFSNTLCSSLHHYRFVPSLAIAPESQSEYFCPSNTWKSFIRNSCKVLSLSLHRE